MLPSARSFTAIQSIQKIIPRNAKYFTQGTHPPSSEFSGIEAIYFLIYLFCGWFISPVLIDG